VIRKKNLEVNCSKAKTMRTECSAFGAKLNTVRKVLLECEASKRKGGKGIFPTLLSNCSTINLLGREGAYHEKTMRDTLHYVINLSTSKDPKMNDGTGRDRRYQAKMETMGHGKK